MNTFFRYILSIFLVFSLFLSVSAQGMKAIIEQVRQERLEQMAAEKTAIPASVGTASPVSAIRDARDDRFPVSQSSFTATGFVPDRSRGGDDDTPSMGLAKYNIQHFPQQQVTADDNVLRRGILAERQVDARLNDICFLNQNLAWVVGDAGVIWFTENGGQTWSMQESGTDAPLYAVHFLNEKLGVAVGGKTELYSHVGKGIFLKTNDGGKTWQNYPIFCAPILYDVKMMTPKTIWAAGSASESYPSGVIFTTDGGLDWSALPGGRSRGWASLDLMDRENASGVGLDGSIQVIRKTSQLVKNPSLGLRRACLVSLFPFQQTPVGMISGWMVGEGGLLMSTPDAGETWQLPRTLPLSPGQSEFFDFQAVFGNGPHVWVAGTPGTRIFHSHDAGTTWEAAPTGVQTPIRKIRFLDPMNGRAVGDLGTILATADGGRTWQIQRVGGTRLAVLGLVPRIQDVPYEVFAQLCLEEGYLGGLELLFRQESMEHDGSDIPAIRRLHEALALCGVGSSDQAWAFTLERDELENPVEKIMERIERENNGSGLAKFRENLVCRIRTWRPNLVLTTDPNSEDGGAVRDFAAREVLLAVQNAANPTAYPQQIMEMGLQPWQVHRVQMVTVTGPSRKGNSAATSQPSSQLPSQLPSQLATQSLSPRIGKTIDEMARNARAIVQTEEIGSTSAVSFITAFDLQGITNQRLMTGINAPVQGEARRCLQYSMANDYRILDARAQKRGNLLGILGKAPENLLVNMESLTENLDPDSAVAVLLEMGEQFHQSGRWKSAAEVYSRIASRYPKHPSTGKAMFWLVRYYFSQETGWRLKQNHVKTNPNSDFRMVSLEKPEIRFDQGTHFVNRLYNSFAELGNNPRVRFALAAAQRNNSKENLAAQFYSTRSSNPDDNVWATRAKGELWLLARNKSQLSPDRQRCPLPIIFCRLASERPFLDGKFDDNSWKNGVPVSMSLPPQRDDILPAVFQPATSQAEMMRGVTKTPEQILREQTAAKSRPFGSQMMFLYDRQFLYIGMRCPKIPGFQYVKPDTTTPRKRDSNLAQQDRMEILLDVDRDYSVYHRLEIDYQGSANDSCWGDTTWNPSWFFAQDEDEQFWYIEAAIPWTALMEQPPKSQDVIGISLRRLVPGFGIEVWNAENSINLTEAFGYLIFE